MPLRRADLGEGGKTFPSPWRGRIDHVHQMRVNIAALTAKEVDPNGFLKPGIPLNNANPATLVTSGAVFGCTIEPLKVAKSNSTADLTAAGVQELTVGTFGQLTRALVEDILDRPLTAPEVAGFAAAGSTLKLL